MRQIFLDTETTGLAADKGDRLVEIGCIEMVSRRLTGRTLHLYLNPERSSHPEALAVHGLTDAFLADKPKFAQIADELLAFVEGAEVIIHNAAFDLGFIDAELRRLGRGPLRAHAASVTDTLAMARELFPGKHASLDALCKRFEVDNRHRQLHGALLDAGLLAEVYVRMTRGQEALVIDEAEGTPGEQALDAVDLSAFVLPVLSADEAEAAAHQALLADLDKASAGRAVWLRRPAQAVA
jgi:DNA polymerase-3 subunit epsilon